MRKRSKGTHRTLLELPYSVAVLNLNEVKPQGVGQIARDFKTKFDFGGDGIWFDSTEIRPDQDGIHLAGECFHGKISNLKGSYGSPNDDFVAINADDCLTRLQNLDLINGAIGDIVIEGLHSEYCRSFLRLLSVDHPVTDVKAKGLYGGCKAFAINLDGARYCKVGTRLIKRTEKRYYRGSGAVEGVKVEDVKVVSRGKQRGLILVETDVRGFVVEGLETAPLYTSTPALALRYTAPCTVTATDADGRALRYRKGKRGKEILPSAAYRKIEIEKSDRRFPFPLDTGDCPRYNENIDILWAGKPDRR